jgi:hypothetical protein
MLINLKVLSNWALDHGLRLGLGSIIQAARTKAGRVSYDFRGRSDREIFGSSQLE